MQASYGFPLSSFAFGCSIDQLAAEIAAAALGPSLVSCTMSEPVSALEPEVVIVFADALTGPKLYELYGLIAAHTPPLPPPPAPPRP